MRKDPTGHSSPLPSPLPPTARLAGSAPRPARALRGPGAARSGGYHGARPGGWKLAPRQFPPWTSPPLPTSSACLCPFLPSLSPAINRAGVGKGKDDEDNNLAQPSLPCPAGGDGYVASVSTRPRFWLGMTRQLPVPEPRLSPASVRAGPAGSPGPEGGGAQCAASRGGPFPDFGIKVSFRS